MDIDNATLQHSEEWLNDHNQPSPAKLEKLVSENTFTSLEALRELADNYNITYDTTTSPRELADRIRLAMDQGETE